MLSIHLILKPKLSPPARYRNVSVDPILALLDGNGEDDDCFDDGYCGRRPQWKENAKR